MERGSGLAIEEVNNAGGVAGRTIEHEIVDIEQLRRRERHERDQRSRQQGGRRDRLRLHNVFDPNDILAAYGAPFLNASTSIDQVTRMKADPEKYRNIFQADPTEVPYGLGFPPFLEDLVAQGLFSPPAKTIYIIEGDIPYGQPISKSCQEAAPELGWEVVGVEPVDTAGGTAPVADWTPFISKVKETGAAVDLQHPLEPRPTTPRS